MLNFLGGKFGIFLNSVSSQYSWVPTWCLVQARLYPHSGMQASVEKTFLLEIYVSSSEKLIKNQIVKLIMDVHLCVISPWTNDCILCSQRWRRSIQSAKTRLGADCGSDHELLIAKLRLKLKKVGKSIRPFRYELNQIPYDYTMGVRNTFKGLDLIECLMNYGLRFVTLYRRQGSRPSPWKRNAKKQNGCLRRPYK